MDFAAAAERLALSMNTTMTTRWSRMSMIFCFVALSPKGARGPSKWSKPYFAERTISASRSLLRGLILAQALDQMSQVCECLIAGKKGGVASAGDDVREQLHVLAYGGQLGERAEIKPLCRVLVPALERIARDGVDHPVLGGEVTHRAGQQLARVAMLRRDGREMELSLPGGRLSRFVAGGMAHGVHRRQGCCEDEEQAPCRAALLSPGTRRPARDDSHQPCPRSVGACNCSLDSVDNSSGLCCAELCRSAGRSKGLLVVSRERPIRLRSPAGPRPEGTILPASRRSPSTPSRAWRNIQPAAPV